MEVGKLVKKLSMSLGKALDRLMNNNVIKSSMTGEMHSLYHWYKRENEKLF
jgi:hypothetical protein